MVRHAEEHVYIRKVDRIAVRHRQGRIVAVVEIVSPGNKAASQNELCAFVEKTANHIAQSVHLLLIDLFPPSKRDPQGIHKAIWDEFIEEEFELPADQSLTLAAYNAGPPPVAYVESVAVGDTLPDMPIFLKPDFYVPEPLGATYRMTWEDFFPAPMKRLLETPTAGGSSPSPTGPDLCLSPRVRLFDLRAVEFFLTMPLNRTSRLVSQRSAESDPAGVPEGASDVPRRASRRSVW